MFSWIENNEGFWTIGTVNDVYINNDLKEDIIYETAVFEGDKESEDNMIKDFTSKLIVKRNTSLCEAMVEHLNYKNLLENNILKLNAKKQELLILEEIKNLYYISQDMFCEDFNLLVIKDKLEEINKAMNYYDFYREEVK